MIIQLVIGACLAALFIGITRALAPRQEVRVYAIGLVVAALAYVGFSVAARSLPWLLVECCGVVFFGVFAVLGTGAAPLLLAMGWGLHAAWDVGLHEVIAVDFVPPWYPMACIGFDVFLAVYIAAWLRRAALGRGTGHPVGGRAGHEGSGRAQKILPMLSVTCDLLRGGQLS